MSKLAALTANHIAIVQRNDVLAKDYDPDTEPESNRLELAISDELESGRLLVTECVKHIADILESAETQRG